MQYSILEEFGQILVKHIRDATFEQFKEMCNGKLNSKSAQIIHKNFEKFTNEQKEIIQSLVLDSIDNTLHHFLWMIEQYEEFDLIKYQDEKKSSYISLRDISDGLCGELYTEDGWIEKYSKYPPSLK